MFNLFQYSFPFFGLYLHLVVMSICHCDITIGKQCFYFATSIVDGVS